MIVSHIAAMSQNRMIGKNGQLPWSLPEDLKYFKEKTNGHMIVMGRKTFESLPKPLPNRLNIVITRQDEYKAPEGVKVLASVEQALEFCDSQTQDWGDEVFIVGGGEIYKQTLDLASTIYLTEIHQDFEGDAQYPELPPDFALAQKEDRFDPMPYSFCLYTRK